MPFGVSMAERAATGPPTTSLARLHACLETAGYSALHLSVHSILEFVVFRYHLSSALLSHPLSHL